MSPVSEIPEGVNRSVSPCSSAVLHKVPCPSLPIPEIWSLRLFVGSFAASFPISVVICFWVILGLFAGECFRFSTTCTHTGSNLTPQLLRAEFWLAVCSWVRIWPLCNMLGIETAFCLKSCSARELYWWLRTWLCFMEYKFTCVNQRRDEICCAVFWLMPHFDKCANNGITMWNLHAAVEILARKSWRWDLIFQERAIYEYAS